MRPAGYLSVNPTPAVVFGCYRQGGLGVARSLGRLGVPVHCIDSNQHTPAFFSKYCRSKLHWDLEGAQTETVDFLIQLGRSIGQPSVLIPTGDVNALFVAAHGTELQDWFIFPDPDPTLIRTLCSKRQMYELAQKHGLSVPATKFPKSRYDVLKYLETMRFPILLKPDRGDMGWFPMSIAHSDKELLELYDRRNDTVCQNVMIQELIPGGNDVSWNFTGYFNRQSRCQVAFTGQKLRAYPPITGSASFGICSRNAQVEIMTTRFLNSVGYKGCVDVDFRYDHRDGQYKILDVNPRVGAIFRLFVGGNGVDVVRALYQDMTGQPVTAPTAAEGRKWVVEDNDLLAFLDQYSQGSISIRDWLRSLRGISEATFLSHDDLLPIMSIPWGPVGDAVRRRAKRLLWRS